MNGNEFISCLGTEVRAIQALGECTSSFATSYAMYSQAESKMCDFLHKNYLNLVSCFDCYGYNANNISIDDVVINLIECFEAGDYNEFLLMLTMNNTVWKKRTLLSKVDIKIYK